MKLDESLTNLRYLITHENKSQDELKDLVRAGVSPQIEAEEGQQLRQAIEGYRSKCRLQLQQLIDFPPRHSRHDELLPRFWSDGAYEKSVFVMTKFPSDAGTAVDQQLDRVLNATSDAIRRCEHVPRIARGAAKYHPGLWDNVELHLLGCPRGIAIVEDRYLKELNPNVAMEWGWMRGMGKPVLFLVEEKFDSFRADLGDLLHERFSWENPEPGILKAVSGWLAAVPRRDTAR